MCIPWYSCASSISTTVNSKRLSAGSKGTHTQTLYYSDTRSQRSCWCLFSKRVHPASRRRSTNFSLRALLSIQSDRLVMPVMVYRFDIFSSYFSSDTTSVHSKQNKITILMFSMWWFLKSYWLETIMCYFWISSMHICGHGVIGDLPVAGLLA